MTVGFAEPWILVEGEKLIVEALQAGLTPVSAWSHGDWPLDLACPSYQVSGDMYKQLSPTRTGQAPLVVFQAPALSVSGPMVQGRYLLLDRLQDPGNAGALVRAAAAFGMDGVFWLKPCVYPYHPAAIRAAAGCTFKIRHHVAESLPSDLSVPIIGAAGEADACDLEGFRWPPAFMLAMGHEGQGLSQTLRSRLTHKVKIPMAAGVESLNVAGAAHILMYHLQRAKAGKPG